MSFCCPRVGKGEAMFHIASAEAIKAGKVTDVYFDRAAQALREAGIRKHVLAEVRAERAAQRLRMGGAGRNRGGRRAVSGNPRDRALPPRGDALRPRAGANHRGRIHRLGRLRDRAARPALPGLRNRHAAPHAARVAAGSRTLISFGARRMHPALAPMIERNAYLGGCDGVAVIASAELLSLTASGTMPHALVLVVGNSVDAFRLYREASPPGQPIICLVDTFGDEKFEALAAAEALGDALNGVRLDTPSSRRGDMLEILREVRWELDLRGYSRVQLIVSGGLDEYEIPRLNELADGYGVGTAISNAPTINFALDIVEVEGVPVTKRGKLSGRKRVLRCPTCQRLLVKPAASNEPVVCEEGNACEDLLLPLTEYGKLVRPLPPVAELRDYVLAQLGALPPQERSLPGPA